MCDFGFVRRPLCCAHANLHTVYMHTRPSPGYFIASMALGKFHDFFSSIFAEWVIHTVIDTLCGCGRSRSIEIQHGSAACPPTRAAVHHPKCKQIACDCRRELLIQPMSARAEAKKSRSCKRGRGWGRRESLFDVFGGRKKSFILYQHCSACIFMRLDMHVARLIWPEWECARLRHTVCAYRLNCKLIRTILLPRVRDEFVEAIGGNFCDSNDFSYVSTNCWT